MQWVGEVRKAPSAKQEKEQWQKLVQLERSVVALIEQRAPAGSIEGWEQLKRYYLWRDVIVPHREWVEGSAEWKELRRQEDFIVEHFSALAMQLASRDPLEGDLVLTALANAIKRFQPEKGWRFSTLFVTIFNHELKRFLETHSRHNPKAYALESVAPPAVREPSLGDQNLIVAEILQSKEWQSLSPRDRIILYKRFGIDPGTPQTLKQIGELVNLSVEGVRKAVFRMTQDLSLSLEEFRP
jgi:hypothetical protein